MPTAENRFQILNLHKKRKKNIILLKKKKNFFDAPKLDKFQKSYSLLILTKKILLLLIYH